METHVFKLLSGVECEIEELTGKQFRILTEKKKGANNSHHTKLNEMLASVIVRVGKVKLSSLSNTPEKKGELSPRMQFIQALTAEDRRFVLTEARQFSMDFEEHFEFVWEYDHEGVTLEHRMSLPIPGGHFPFKPMDEQVEEYDHLQREVELTLPRSGKKAKFTVLDGKGELIGSHDKNPSLATLFKMRRVQYFNPEHGEKGVWVTLPFDSVGQKDLGYIMGKMKENEGKVDTELKFEHPKADEMGLTGKERYVVLDVLDSPAFFFPQGTD